MRFCGRAIGTWSGFSAITTAIGPVAGGWLVEHVSWRAVFFINVPLATVVLFLSVRHIEESKDPSRSGRLDWTGAALAVVGLTGLVFGLLEWPPLGATHPLVIGALVVGAAGMVVLFIVERRTPNPMLPLSIFRSRTFALANLLTLLLYAALSVMLFLVTLNLIQVQKFSATAAGAAILPFPFIIFALSRWSGGLVARIGHRIPLTVGPLIAALGLGLLAIPRDGGSFWTAFFPGIVVLGLGMAVTVAPLTTTVMDAAESGHSGVASGVNNAVSRIAGLIAIAVFGIVITRTFDSSVGPRLDRLALSSDARASVQRELPKMAGAELSTIPSLSPPQRAAAREAIDSSFSSAFRVAMAGAALLALGGAIVGVMIL